MNVLTKALGIRQPFELKLGLAALRTTNTCFRTDRMRAEDRPCGGTPQNAVERDQERDACNTRPACEQVSSRSYVM